MKGHPLPTAIKKSFTYGSHTVNHGTGEVAARPMVPCSSMDDTVVLATVVAAKNAKPGQDFFPLTVDYVESSTRPAVSPAVSSSAKAVRPKGNP